MASSISVYALICIYSQDVSILIYIDPEKRNILFSKIKHLPLYNVKGMQCLIELNKMSYSLTVAQYLRKARFFVVLTLMLSNVFAPFFPLADLYASLICI